MQVLNAKNYPPAEVCTVDYPDFTVYSQSPAGTP